MSKRKKRRLRIQQNPRNVTLSQLRQVLEDYGFLLDRTSGSHHTFKVMIDKEWVALVIPFARPVKPIYVKEALKLIELIEAARDNNEETDDESPTNDQDA
jgi:predicted RNA binding protein YcfA (HicA-like mRNA interferase family)